MVSAVLLRLGWFSKNDWMVYIKSGVSGIEKLSLISLPMLFHSFLISSSMLVMFFFKKFRRPLAHVKVVFPASGNAVFKLPVVQSILPTINSSNPFKKVSIAWSNCVIGFGIFLNNFFISVNNLPNMFSIVKCLFTFIK